jgi:Uncharacterised protein family (UPF0175)
VTEKEVIVELTFAIPDELSAPLHEAYGDDLGRAAVEQLALDGYRSGKLSRYQVQLLLGFDNRYDPENWLGDRAANLNYNLGDLQADQATLDQIL